jgi:hypothetical protein
MPEITIKFELGGTRHTLWQLLWNLRERGTVAGPMSVEVDGIHQDWWDEEEAKAKRAAEESAQRSAEWKRRNREMLDEIERDPSRTDEEIAAKLGCHPAAIYARRGRN